MMSVLAPSFLGPKMSYAPVEYGKLATLPYCTLLIHQTERCTITFLLCSVYLFFLFSFLLSLSNKRIKGRPFKLQLQF